MFSLVAFTIPGLEWLSKAFAYAFKWLYSLTGNFGLAIILLTVAMRIVILPLTIKQTKSMIAMQKLQPQLKEIQKKYKGEKEKMGQEMMKLYKENKVSPFGGCLPLLLQLPIIFAVFDVLHSLSAAKPKYINIIGVKTNFVFLGMDVRQKGSVLWAKGSYTQIIVVILLTVITGYISAKMMTTDPKQAKMMAMMPVLFGVFAWILPAGVTVYIVVTNILTVVQQYAQLEREGFYDERRAQREKAGEPVSSFERFKYKLREYTSKSLVALRIKPVLEPEKKGRVESGKSMGAKKAEPAARTGGTGQKKKPVAKKQEQAPTGKQVQGERETGGKTADRDRIKSYPARKKSKGKK